MVRSTAVQVHKAISMAAALLQLALLRALDLLVLRDAATAQLVVVGCGGYGLLHTPTPGEDLFMTD
jgi:hypothetical protein